jgi:hypothetical protein
MFCAMSEDREIELTRAEYRQAFDRPLASPKHLRWSLRLSFAMAFGVAAVAVWLDVWWLTFGVIPVAMYAGAALAGLWPNFFFGSDPNKDNFT